MVYDDYKGQTKGWYTDSEGKQHGLCGYDATITFNDQQEKVMNTIMVKFKEIVRFII